MPIRLNGSTSGFVELAAPAVAGSTVLELPTDSIKPGMVLITSTSFTAQSTVSIDNCFSSLYDNYRLVYRLDGSSTQSFRLRWRASGADNTSSAYSSGYNFSRIDAAGGGDSRMSATTTSLGLVDSTATADSVGYVDIIGPRQSTDTIVFAHAITYEAAAQYHVVMTGRFAGTSVFDGLTVYPSANTITGSLHVYGYRKA